MLTLFFYKSPTNTPFYPEGSASIVTSLIIPKGKECIGNESAQRWTTIRAWLWWFTMRLCNFVLCCLMEFMTFFFFKKKIN